MILDLSTLTVVQLLLALAMAGAVLVVARGREVNDGLRWWGVGLLLYGLSYAAFAMRFLGWERLSFVFTSALVSATLAAHSVAVSHLKEIRLPRPLLWLPIVVVGVAAALLADAHVLRNLESAAVLSLQAAMLAWLAWKPIPSRPHTRGQVLIVLGSGLLAAVFLGRIAAALGASPTLPTSTVTDEIQAVTYFVTLFVTVLNTLGYVSMNLEHAESRMRHEATHDALTGIANRRAGLEALEREWSRAQRTGQPLAVLMLDLDHFKQVNDTHGHQAGDRVLREIALRAKARLRGHDTVARYGGEEFLVLLPDTDAIGAMAVADGLRVAALTPIETDGTRIEITVSLGVYSQTVGRDGPAPDAMITAADRALYRAKEAGRNRCVLET